jgi:K+-sensing histidine kinase KdpD
VENLVGLSYIYHCTQQLLLGLCSLPFKKTDSGESSLEDRVEERTKEVKQQADELATVNQISQALVSQADLHDLIKLVGDQLRDLFKANIVYIALLDKKQNHQLPLSIR